MKLDGITILRPCMTRKEVAEKLGISVSQVEYSENRALFKFLLLMIEAYDYDFETLARDVSLSFEDLVRLFFYLRKRYYLYQK